MPINEKTSVLLEPLPDGIGGDVEFVDPGKEQHEIASARIQEAQIGLDRIEQAIALSHTELGASLDGVIDFEVADITNKAVEMGCVDNSCADVGDIAVLQVAKNGKQPLTAGALSRVPHDSLAEVLRNADEAGLDVNEVVEEIDASVARVEAEGTHEKSVELLSPEEGLRVCVLLEKQMRDIPNNFQDGDSMALHRVKQFFSGEIQIDRRHDEPIDKFFARMVDDLGKSVPGFGDESLISRGYNESLMYQYARAQKIIDSLVADPNGARQNIIDQLSKDPEDYVGQMFGDMTHGEARSRAKDILANSEQRELVGEGDGSLKDLLSDQVVSVVDVARDIMHQESVNGGLLVYNEEQLHKMILGLSVKDIASLAKDFPGEAGRFADLISETSGKLPVHMSNLPLIQELTGLEPLEWRGAIRDGKDLPKAAKIYANSSHLASAIYAEGLRNIGPNTSPEDEKIFLDGVAGMLKYSMDIEGNPQRANILQSFMTGDLLTYGMQADSEGRMRPNKLFYHEVQRYLDNVDSLGVDRVETLHDTFGTVNFDAYRLDTLESMVDIAENPSQHPEVSVVIRGQNSDHNFAFGQDFVMTELKDTVIFEIATNNGLVQARDTISRLGVGVKRLTLAGHGGKDGLRFSRDYVLERNEESVGDEGLQDLIGMITPDEGGDRQLILSSCSQGKKFGMDRHSLADIFVKMSDDDLVVRASPDVAYVYPEHSHTDGELIAKYNKFYNLSKWLGQYPKIPGVKRLASWLIDRNRQETGMLVVRKSGTYLDKTGKMKIGGR